MVCCYEEDQGDEQKDRGENVVTVIRGGNTFGKYGMQREDHCRHSSCGKVSPCEVRHQYHDQGYDEKVERHVREMVTERIQTRSA